MPWTCTPFDDAHDSSNVWRAKHILRLGIQDTQHLAQLQLALLEGWVASASCLLLQGQVTRAGCHFPSSQALDF
jgi:hypothetical protein